MRITAFLTLSAVFGFYSASALAGTICRPVEHSRDEVQCSQIEDMVEQLEASLTEQPHGPKIRVADMAYTWNDMLAFHQVGVEDVLVIDVQNRYRTLKRQLSPETLPDVTVRRLSETLPRILHVPPVLPDLPDFPELSDWLDHHDLERPGGPGGLDIRRSALAAAEPHPEVHEGVNTDGQFVYGPPGAATFGCSGWPQIDQCMTCCSASRSSLLPLVYLSAKKCHGVIANMCGPWLWACHAGCAVVEAAAIGAIYYNFKQCNDACHIPYWNDISVDWSGASKQSLHWDDDAVECEGWLMAGDVPLMNGAEHVSIPGHKLARTVERNQDGTPRHGRFEGSCVVLDGSGHEIETNIRRLPSGQIPTTYVRVMGHERRCPAPAHPTYDRRYIVSTEQRNNGIVCVDAIDFRVIDLDPNKAGHQQPTIDYIVVQGDDEAFYFQLGDGSRLYLDGLPTSGDAYWRRDHYTRQWDWWPDKPWKIWVYGPKSGNRLRVTDWGLLTPEF